MSQASPSTNIVRNFKMTFIRGSRSCSEDSDQGSKKVGSLKLKLQQRSTRGRYLCISTATPHVDDQKPSSAIQLAFLAYSSHQNTPFHVAM